jgi:hypothetical protein
MLVLSFQTVTMPPPITQSRDTCAVLFIKQGSQAIRQGSQAHAALAAVLFISF